jgi:hypothetical protein
MTVLPAYAQDVLPTMDDPRVGLAAGPGNSAGQAALGMRLVSWSPKPAQLDSARGLAFINSDLAFRGNVVYQGNFSGFMIWDVSDPAKPALLSTVVCATDQGDPSIYGNLLFISAESVRRATTAACRACRMAPTACAACASSTSAIRAAAPREERADVSRLAYAHHRAAPDGPRCDLHLRRRLVVRARRRGDAGMLVGHGGREPEHRAVPRGHHPRAAGYPRAGGGRGLRAHLRGASSGLRAGRASP